MSRRRNALIAAAFTYGQNVGGMLLSLFVTRVVLAHIGRDLYGVWSASGALLAYAGLADLGVLGLLPWMIAEADGRKDASRMRSLLSNATAFALLAGFGFAAVATALWFLYPSLLNLSHDDIKLLAGPVYVVIIATGITFPLRIFGGLLTGLQDATFLGVVSVVQVTATSGLTLALALAGYGLYAIACGAALPPFISALAHAARALKWKGELFKSWPAPHLGLVKELGVDGIGTWLASLGFQLAVGTDPAILAHLGQREQVASFVISTRLASAMMSLGWILPDAGLVGLAQLAGEGARARVREIVMAVLRLNLLVGGAVASVVLAANGTFIRLWVGSDFFLGERFTAVVALNMALFCAIHGLVTVASVLGKRIQVGVAFIANGVLHIVLATVLGRYLSTNGVVLATLLSGLITCVPVGLLLLAPAAGVTVRAALTEVFLPWGLRYAPLFFIALGIGTFAPRFPIPLVIAMCAAFGLLYLRAMRALYVGLPLGPRISKILRMLRLLDVGV